MRACHTIIADNARGGERRSRGELNQRVQASKTLDDYTSSLPRALPSVITPRYTRVTTRRAISSVNSGLINVTDSQASAHETTSTDDTSASRFRYK